MRLFGVLLIALLIAAIAYALWRGRARSGDPGADADPAGPSAGDDAPAEPAAAPSLPSSILPPPEPPPPDPAAAAAAQRVASAVHALAFGVPAITGLVPTAHARTFNEALAALEGALDEPRYMPRRPSVIPELLRAVNDEDSSRRQIGAIIARDPALAADLLKLANTAYYRVSAQPVESIDRAVAVLGTTGIRTLVSSAALQPVFQVPAGSFTRFPSVAWDQAFLSGMAAESIAAVAENEDPFAAQLLALLMGLGGIVAFRVTYEHYGRDPALAPDAEVFAMLLDRQAAPLARRIAQSWELSERMITALNDQITATATGPAALSRLGRSLLLGRTMGSLALLAREGRVDTDEARTAATTAGVPARLFDRLWQRLTQQA